MNKMNVKTLSLALAMGAVVLGTSAQASASCDFGNPVKELEGVILNIFNPWGLEALATSMQLDEDVNLIQNPSAPSGNTYGKTVDGVNYWAIFYGPKDPQTLQHGEHYVRVEIETPDGKIVSNEGSLAQDGSSVKIAASYQDEVFFQANTEYVALICQPQ